MRASRQLSSSATRAWIKNVKAFPLIAPPPPVKPAHFLLRAPIAERLATSTAAAFAEHEKAHESDTNNAFVKILRLGCCEPPSDPPVGSALVSAMANEELRLSAVVMNVDASQEVVTAAAEAVGASQDKQSFRVWDVAAGEGVAGPLPILPSPLYACGASSRYDLLVDCGALDAALQKGEGEAEADVCDRVLSYFSFAREYLQMPSVDSARPPLLVMHGAGALKWMAHADELLKEAFPAEDGFSIQATLFLDDEEALDWCRYSVWHGSSSSSSSSSSSQGDGWKPRRYKLSDPSKPV